MEKVARWERKNGNIKSEEKGEIHLTIKAIHHIISCN
jgi:hypothetical protein